MKKNYEITYTKMKEQYNVFLNEYGKLCKKMKVSDPYQMELLFNYMLYNGYLSKDKYFEYSTLTTTTDLIGFSAAGIFNGMACSRQASMALSDILNNQGIKSDTLMVFNRLNIKHYLTLATLNEKVYYLDPIEKYLYRMKKMRGNFLYASQKDDDKFLIVDNPVEFAKIMALGYEGYQNISAREQAMLEKELTRKLGDSKRLLERFYTEHKELYGDILYKSKKVLVRMREK